MIDKFADISDRRTKALIDSMVQPKCEGQSYLYDPEGFDPTEALERYHKLKRRWFKTRKVRAEMTDLDAALLIHSRRHLRAIEKCFPVIPETDPHR